MRLISLRRMSWILALIWAVSLASDQDAKKPISRQGFFKAVEIGGLSNEELVSYIKDLGVDFELQAPERQSLVAKGVPGNVLEALEVNYRMPLTSREQEQVVAALSSGPPLSKDQLIGLLRMGTARPILEQVVVRRKTGFDVGPTERTEFEAAGASPRFVASLVQNRYMPELPPPVQVTAPGVPQAGAPAIAKVAAPPPPINQAAAALLDKKIVAAQLIEKIPPVYPEMARRQRVSGMVRMELVIDEKGKVESIRTLSGHPFLVGPASTAVKQWKYAPATINGVPVKVTTILELVFRPS